MEQVLKFPKGSVVTFSTGEYSSYYICGYIVAVKDMDLPALLEQFKAAYIPEYSHDRPDASGFVSWLIAQGYALPVDASEVHIDTHYGQELTIG